MTRDRSHLPPRPDLPAAVAWRLALARVAMAWERVWPALWPALAILAVFASLSLMGLWDQVPEALQALAVFAMILGSGTALWRHLSRTRLPARLEGLRRLETDSGLKHRPLSTYADRPAGGLDDPRTRHLWQLHRERMGEDIAKTGIVLPRTNAPDHDPYALRLLIVLLLGVSIMVAGTDSGTRLRASISPLLGPGLPADLEIDAWVEPPAYTGLPGLPLLRGYQPGQGEAWPDRGAIDVPEGSTLIVRLTGFGGRPILSLDPVEALRAADRPQPTISFEDGVAQSRAPISVDLDAGLSVLRRNLGTWQFSVRGDLPPAVSMPEAPQGTASASLRFFYRFVDDYGVTAAEAQLRLVPESPEEALALAQPAEAAPSAGAPSWPRPDQPVVLSLPVSSVGGATIRDETAIENLAAHPWAGREVMVQIRAEDGAGQHAYSDAARITLPRRVFLDPLARSFVELRDILARTSADGPVRVAAAIDAMTAEGERFFEDPIIYFGLRTAYWRLTHNPRPRQTREIYDLLWDLALRVEDGDLSDTLRTLRQLQQALADALQRNAPPGEIRQLMAQLREAMDRYLAELAQQSDQQAADPDAVPLSSNDLDDLLQAIEQLGQMGETGRARQLLSELQNILEGLKPGGGQGQAGANGPPSPQDQALQEALGSLSDIIGRQRSLLDETYRNSLSRGGPGDDLPGGPTGSLPRKTRPRGPVNGVPGNAQPGADGTAAGGTAGGRTGLERDGMAGKLSRQGIINSPGTDGETQGLAGEQAGLRDALSEVLRGLDGNGLPQPDSLGEAVVDMEAARSALEGDQFHNAFRNQRAALDALRSAAEDLAKDVLRREGKGSVARRDPLGRSGRNGLSNGAVDLPTKSDLQRAREILEELRRRAGERGRPQQELDYFNRLLHQF
ncbi:MAG: TIGR02302 family protein [Alphaproteobacteria bacterium]